MLASYGKMEAKDGNRPFCSIVPNSLGSRVVDGWSHKVCKQGDCGHVTPLSWQKPQHSPCSNKRALTPGSQGCFSSLPCGSNAEITTKEWGELRNFSKEVGHFWVGFFFFFFFNWFPPVRLVSGKTGCLQSEKNPSPSPTPTPPPFPLACLQAPMWHLSKFISASAVSRSGGVCEKRHPTALVPSGYFVSDLCLGIISFGCCWESVVIHALAFRVK